MNKKLDILGVKVDCLNYKFFFDSLKQLIHSNGKGYVTLTGAHGIIEASENEQLKTAYDKSWVNAPDGMPLVWIMKSRGIKNVERIYGPKLMLKIFELSCHEKWTHYLYGGNTGVSNILDSKLREKYPGCEIVANETPPFSTLSEKELIELAQRINTLCPNFIWIGISAVKQEVLMMRLEPYLNKGVLFGVGAAFDFNAGLKPECPEFLQKIGLQWLQRALTEPLRLGPRYLKIVPLFIVKYFISLFKNTTKS